MKNKPELPAGNLYYFEFKYPDKNMIDMDNNESLIIFLKQVLSFYANKDNFTIDINDLSSVSLINLDKGHQARYAIELINNQLAYNEEFKSIDVNDELNKYMRQETRESITNMLKTIKQNEDKDQISQSEL